jgi:hypothetical protein
MGLSYSPDFADVENVNYTSGSLTVGTSQQLASANGSSNLSKRQELLIYNKSSNTLYFGPTGVTTSTGIPLAPGETLNVPFGEAVSVYLIAAGAGNACIVQEIG